MILRHQNNCHEGFTNVVSSYHNGQLEWDSYDVKKKKMKRISFTAFNIAKYSTLLLDSVTPFLPFDLQQIGTLKKEMMNPFTLM
jgi:hypothetical protein